MKKLKIIAASAAAVMAFQVCAHGIRFGNIEYISDKLETNAPYAGALEVKVPAEDKESNSKPKLYTGVFKKESGTLEYAAVSGDLTDGCLKNELNIPTLENFELKNYIWDGENLIPYNKPREKSIALSAFLFGEKIKLKWQCNAAESPYKYIISKNGEIIAETYGSENEYTDGESLESAALYKVEAADKNGEIISFSNDAEIKPKTGEYKLTAADLVQNGTNGDVAARCYSESDRQVALVGDPSLLDYETKTGMGSDRCWTVAEAFGEKCVYTTYYYTSPEKTARKYGKITVDLGEDFRKDDKGVSIGIRFYSEGSGKIRLRYLSGVDENGKAKSAYKDISCGETGWKTAEVQLDGAYFNGAETTGFSGNGDFRFEYYDCDIYISEITVKRFNGELKTDIENPAGGDISVKGYVLEKLAEPQWAWNSSVSATNKTEENIGNLSYGKYVDYKINGNNDTAYALAEIGGKKALFSAALLRNDGTWRTGQLSFALNSEKIDFENRRLDIEVEYFDNGESIYLTYVNGAENGKHQTAAKNIKTDADGEWKKAVFSLDDAYLNYPIYNESKKRTEYSGFYDGSPVFRFSCSKPVYISSVRVLNEDYLNRINENTAAPTLFLAGDSTCEVYSKEAYPREGWGMEIGKFFSPELKIVNNAKGGKSTKSFLNNMDIWSTGSRADSRWSYILEQGKAGDYLFIQFGHNERGSLETDDGRYTSPTLEEASELSYRYNLKRFIVAAKEKGMIPVILTSVWQRAFDENGRLSDTTIEPYRQAARETGEKYGVAVLEVGDAHRKLVEAAGIEGSKELYVHIRRDDYPDFPSSFSTADNTHMSALGAEKVAGIIVEELKKNAAEHKELNALCSYLKIAE